MTTIEKTRDANVTARRVARITKGMPTSDGAGVKLTRLIGSPELPDIDPILMLDTFRSDDANDYIAGFPPHPHRGFETVSYMIKGKLQHRDNKGGEGLIVDGGVQWMKAARGVVHSEMPAQTGGSMFGFQLWLNLPAAEKMSTPWYADIGAEKIPTIALADGASVKLIAGLIGDVRGPGPERVTAPFIADLTVPAYGRASLPVPQGHAAIAYVFEGAASFGSDAEPKTVRAGELAVLTDGAALEVAGLSAGARMLIVAAIPLKEPIAKYGPFVMNTQNELRQAIEDFRRGAF